jgi:putative ABC transport system permease protein
VFSIAWKNLLKERTRLGLTLVGVVFAVVLMFFDIAAYLGFVSASSVLIDHAKADVWITLQNSRNFDSSRPFPERKLWQVKQIRGVAAAVPMAKGWSQMKLASGSTETVMIVGFDPDAGLGLPWKLREGDVRDLRVDRTVIIDESALRKLEGLGVGDETEISDTAVTVVGISEEVRSFTTYPTIFANYETAKRLATVYRTSGSDQTTFILVKVVPGHEIAEVVRRVKALGGIDAYASQEFSAMTRRYWIVQTGMGIGFGVVALLGFFVGMVIVGQTIYSSTIEHLREYGTLKALGATGGEIVALIVYQALVYALVGYVVGVSLALAARPGYESLGLKMVTTPGMGIGMFVVTVAMCVGASIASVRRALRVDPALVFRA